MTDKYTISCVIPTCDRNDLLIESLYSILNQTHKPNEIIIVNNGREELALPEPFAKVMAVHNIIPYAGVAQARNFEWKKLAENRDARSQLEDEYVKHT